MGGELTQALVSGRLPSVLPSSLALDTPSLDLSVEDSSRPVRYGLWVVKR